MLRDIAVLTDPDTFESSVSLDSQGNPIEVKGFAAVAQQLSFMILIAIRSYLPDPNLGTTVGEMLGNAHSKEDFIPLVYSDIKKVVDSLIQMQNDLDQVIPLEDSERVTGLIAVSIDENNKNPSQFFLDVTVITADKTARNVAVPLR